MNDKIIKFKIVTPEKTVLSVDIAQVTVPTKDGEITVLLDHIPLVASLRSGIIEIVTTDGSRDVMSVSGGFIEIADNKVVILADTAERAEEIDIDRTEEARTRAEKTIKETRHFDRERFAGISAKIAKELARGRAAKRWKKIKSMDK